MDFIKLDNNNIFEAPRVNFCELQEVHSSITKVGASAISGALIVSTKVLTVAKKKVTLISCPVTARPTLVIHAIHGGIEDRANNQMLIQLLNDSNQPLLQPRTCLGQDNTTESISSVLLSTLILKPYTILGLRQCSGYGPGVELNLH